jgi:hypothetical protein
MATVAPDDDRRIAMNSPLLHWVRATRTSANRTSSGRRTATGDTGFRYGASGHGSRMPSQRATTRMQRPY